MTTPIHLPTLKAVSQFASIDDGRYYLRGVYVKAEADAVTYVATDGKSMAVRRIKLTEAAGTTIGEWIIPYDDCRAFKVGKKDSEWGDLTQKDDGALMIEHNGTGRIFKPVDGTFPAWHNVIPRTTTGVLNQSMDGDMLARVDAFGRVLDLGLKTCHWNGDGPSVFTFEEDHAAFCVLMPMRNPADASWSIPAWVDAARHEAQKKAA